MKNFSTLHLQNQSTNSLFVHIRLAALVIVTVFTLQSKVENTDASNNVSTKNAVNATFLSWVICIL